MEKSAAETVVSAPNGGGSSFGIKGSMVAMAIARRGTRPCDVCGLECAKWYCAADDAYLCERCDGSVHGANAVALRHERLKLGPNGVPMKNVRRILPLPSDLKSSKSSKDHRPESGSARHGWHHGTMRRPRSARPHPHANSVPKVKAEPGSPKLEDLFSDEFFACSKEFACGKEEQEVPIFVPLVPDHCFDLGFAKSEDSFSLEPPSTECLIRANTGLSVADECDLDRFLECDGDLCEMDSIMGNMEEFPSIVEMVAMDGKDMADDNYNMDFSEVEAFRSSNEPSDDSGDGGDDVDGPLHEFCGKIKMEEQELDKIKLEVDEMLGCAFSSVKDEEGQQKISLRLNYEDVMSAWSDRGPFWTEGPRPQTVPDVCNFDTMDMIVPDYGFYHMEQNGQVPVMHMGDEGYHRGREARVMRYREKRRTRLFSKKIRYEVRKLNAERRPRLKGRFVKRSLCS